MVLLPWQKTEQGFDRVPTEALDEDENEEPLVKKHYKQPSSSIARLMAITVTAVGIAITFGALGFFAGQRSQVRVSPFTGSNGAATKNCTQQATHDEYVEGLLSPAGDVDDFMVWNGTFAHIDPSKDNYDDAWKLLYPGHTLLGGIVQHPRLAPETASLAVYHQLHCIVSLKPAHLVMDALLMNFHQKQQVIHDNFWREIVNPGPANRTRLPFHMEQCLDYLTQGIMCAADTNLEPVNPDMYGAKTAIPRKCRNIRSVFDWARRWATKMPLEELNYVFSAHRELERTVYIPGFKSQRFPSGNTCGGADPCPN
ncbi:hypothetical protein PISL3812_06642 [Talaromyces islandicus]|uniref:Tat pathway signal sequence n=1 Tax=Talaromyces islandicus TaxID=28573 RepID=A0A0U1M249_TALIS|nr:hypothetical protein PISL3812_06642 [Talaromyces islandicus]